VLLLLREAPTIVAFATRVAVGAGVGALSVGRHRAMAMAWRRSRVGAVALGEWGHQPGAGMREAG